MKMRHIERLQAGKCELKMGFAFNDLLNNLERIADHCSNVAIALIEMELKLYDPHEYLKKLRETKDYTYKQCFEEYEAKYDINKYQLSE